MGNASSTRRSPTPNYDDYLAPEKKGKSRRSRSPSPFRTLRESHNSNDQYAPPPPYYPGPASSGNRGIATIYAEHDDNEDALDLLRKFNVVFIVDDSSSMSLKSSQGTRWKEAGAALAAIADVASKYDVDGIDIHFLNNEASGNGLKNSAQVRRLFASLSLMSSTPIGGKLEELLLHYLDVIETAQKRGGRKALSAIKPVNYIIITDGHPTDDPESVIVAAAKRLDAGNFPLSQVGIQFVQIGDSRSAKKYLEDLDTYLHERQGIRDIVDTTPYNGKALDADALVKILLGGINRRVDRT